MNTTAQDHNWQAAGYGPEEAAEWRAAGVMTPAEAREWMAGGLRPGDRDLADLVEGEWLVAGLAILVPAEQEPEDAAATFVGTLPGALFAAARVVWARQQGRRRDVDRGRLMAELTSAHPGVAVAWWRWAITVAVRHAERFERECGPVAPRRGRRFGASQVGALGAIEAAGDAGISLAEALRGGNRFDWWWTFSYLRHLIAAIERHNAHACPANCPLADEVLLVEMRGPRGGQRWKVADHGTLQTSNHEGAA